MGSLIAHGTLGIANTDTSTDFHDFAAADTFDPRGPLQPH